MAATTAALDSIIALAERAAISRRVARRDRVNASGITASEDGAVENGTSLRFGMPVPNDASSLKWRITDEEGDTIYSRTSAEIRYRFKSGDYQIFAAPVNGCGSGDWSSHSVSVNEIPETHPYVWARFVVVRMYVLVMSILTPPQKEWTSTFGLFQQM